MLHLKRYLSFLFFIISSVYFLTGLSFLSSSISESQDLYSPEYAFRFSASEVDRAVIVRFHIAEGYYLYRERFSFSSEDTSVKFGIIEYPQGEVLFDANFDKKMEVYRGILKIKIPLYQQDKAFTLKVDAQGCSDKGVCYMPMQLSYRVQGIALSSQPTAAQTTQQVSSNDFNALFTQNNQLGKLEQFVQNANPFWVILAFFILGLLLAFTPCVLPMAPILFSLILGEEKKNRVQSFVLSLSYILGMALIYTFIGVFAALLGQSFASLLQTWWVLLLFVAVLVAIALSMFGCYRIELPLSWRDQFSAVLQRQRGGYCLGAFLMGAVSALVVSPCMSAPLAAILSLIAATGNVYYGAILLFCLALGMGIPLLCMALGADIFLPKTGIWMIQIKMFLGILLLATALWLLNTLLPIELMMLLIALFLLGCAAYLRTFEQISGDYLGWKRLGKTIGVLCTILAIFFLIGVFSGAEDVFKPLMRLTLAERISTLSESKNIQDSLNSLDWQQVSDVTVLEKLLLSAKKPVVLSFYADWCISCKEMKRFTFTDKEVQKKLSAFQLVQVDVTQNNEINHALLAKFSLFGPPAVLFFNQGQEIRNARVVGYLSAKPFSEVLDNLSEYWRIKST